MANKIHPTAIIEGDVALGEDNEIGPYTVIYGPTRIGNNNLIGPHVTIGTPGQDTRTPRYDASACRIEIGNDNIIREYTAIQKPCYREATRIGNSVYLMQGVHVPHDAIIEDHVVITPLVVMGGIVHVLEGANLAIGTTVHQYSVIGQYAIVGMGAPLTKNLRPFSRYVPGKPLSVNHNAIRKYGLEALTEEIEAYVLQHRAPDSPRLQQIVDHYQQLHLASGRPEY